MDVVKKTVMCVKERQGMNPVIRPLTWVGSFAMLK
jgi:hypothetical protein